MIYKKDWFVSFNPVLHTATLYTERIPVHLWFINYIANIPQFILHYVNIRTLSSVVKPLQRFYKKKFILHKIRKFDCKKKGSISTPLNSLFKDIFHALIYPLREINLWLKIRQMYYGDFGEYWYWKINYALETYTTKKSINAEFKFPFAIATKLFPEEYRKFTALSDDITVLGTDTLFLKKKMECEQLFNEYVDSMNGLESEIASKEKYRYVIKNCQTCNRDKYLYMGRYECTYNLSGECGVCNYSKWIN